MNQTLRKHADQIVKEAISAVQPDTAVQRAVTEQTGRRMRREDTRTAIPAGNWWQRVVFPSTLC